MKCEWRGRIWTKNCFLSVQFKLTKDLIDFHEFLWKRIYRSNGKLLQPIKKEEKWNKKARRRLSNIFFSLVGRWCLCWKYGLGGEVFGREGKLVREGSRVGWIEETQRKTMACCVKEGSDRHHVSFSSPLSCSLLCFVVGNAIV